MASAPILDDHDAELFLHAENLHRAGLTALEELDAIAGYHKARSKVVDAKRQPHDRGISSTANALGRDRRLVRKAIAAQSICEEARALLGRDGQNKRGLIAELSKMTVNDQLAHLQGKPIKHLRQKKQRDEGSGVTLSFGDYR